MYLEAMIYLLCFATGLAGYALAKAEPYLRMLIGLLGFLLIGEGSFRMSPSMIPEFTSLLHLLGGKEWEVKVREGKSISVVSPKDWKPWLLQLLLWVENG